LKNWEKRMNRRDLFKSVAATAIVGGFARDGNATTIVDPAPPQQPNITPQPRETLLLDKGWRFHDGDIAMPVLITHDQTYNAAKAGRALGAASPAYDDSDWAEVTLPHDSSASSRSRTAPMSIRATAGAASSGIAIT
jgi:beta-galactosidase